jgi:hypothetical protein
VASAYPVLLALHVVTAVLGLGQVAGIALLASASQGPPSAAVMVALRRLNSGTSWAALIMLLTGVGSEYSLGGAYHETRWFRISILLLVAYGALNGSTRRTLRKLDDSSARPLQRVARNAWIMVLLVAVATVLMELKPG